MNGQALGISPAESFTSPSRDSFYKHKIVVVEDAIDLARGLVMNLEFEGYKAQCVHTGAAAIEIVRADRPQLVLLDIFLPDMSGLAVLEAIRSDGYFGPVAILSALNSDWDEKVAYRLGANCYIHKPFDLLELLECVKNEIVQSRSRSRGAEAAELVHIDEDRHVILVRGTAIHFTPKQFDVLRYIVRANGRIVSKKELLSKVWGLPETINTTTLETHIKQIRGKLEPYALAQAIVSIPKIGFRWVP